MNQSVKHKVIAYITNQDRLLLFRHTAYPEAGIQVPTGAVEAGEDLEQAMLREAAEESGLHDLSDAMLSELRNQKRTQNRNNHA